MFLMETLVVNAIIGLFLALFGAMAIVPFLIEGNSTRTTPLALEDDQIISIKPVADSQVGRYPVTPIAMPATKPDHREAA
jgi:hypothetical protein